MAQRIRHANHRVKPGLDGMMGVVRDPHPVALHFLRGQKANLLDVCPKFALSSAPVLFHLPDRTIDRILESVSAAQVPEMYLENCRSRFGLDKEVVKSQLPRWVSNKDVQKASRVSTQLAILVTRRAHLIPDAILTDILQVTGLLAESNVISEESAAGVVRAVFPKCLDKLNLSKSDIYKMLYSLNRIRISPSDAHVYPLIANFTIWYLERSRLNTRKRIRQKDVSNMVDAQLIEP